MGIEAVSDPVFNPLPPIWIDLAYGYRVTMI